MPRSQDPRGKGSERTPVLVSERIPFLPLPIRSALISLFCPSPQQGAAFSDPRNEDCLARIYLGSRADGNGNEYAKQEFMLRNFPFSLEKVEMLELDKKRMARTIARALAVLHWRVGTDGRDVEFVLGWGRGVVGLGEENVLGEKGCSEPDTEREDLNTSPPNTHPSAQEGGPQIWLLDFNQCASITRNENGCIKAAEAFLQNDPYFPRPGTGREQDEELWQGFVDEYVGFGKKILGGDGKEKESVMGLPCMFIDTVARMVKEREGKNVFVGSGEMGPPKSVVMPARKKKGTATGSGKGKSSLVDLESLMR